MSIKQKVLLGVIDGVGSHKPGPHNAVYLANTPNFRRLWADPHRAIQLGAHGRHVGLLDTQMGNSEVGHLAIGCGVVHTQQLTSITDEMGDGSFFQREAWGQAMQSVGDDKTLHLLGLLSDGGVHSHIDHWICILKQANKDGIKKVRLHTIFDGRDVAPWSASEFLRTIGTLLDEINENPDRDYLIASGAGRANSVMDRADVWKIIQTGWDTHVLGEGKQYKDLTEAIAEERIRLTHEKGGHDKFTDQDLGAFVIAPHGEAVGKMEDGDTLILMNFRTDRMTRWVRMFQDDELPTKAQEFGVDRKVRPKIDVYGLVQYDKALGLPTKFFVPALEIEDGILDLVGAEGGTMLSISESSKGPHVTEFFNKLSKKWQNWHHRNIIENMQADFSQDAWMKTREITAALTSSMEEGTHPLTVFNYPNPDMVGHETDEQAKIASVEAIDWGIGKLCEVADRTGHIILFGGDHGNAEMMYQLDPSGNILWKDRAPVKHTAHTTNPVIWAIHDPTDTKRFRPNIENPGLANLTATTAQLMGLDPLDHWAPSLLAS